MLKFVEEYKAELEQLPANLREIADDILYGKEMIKKVVIDSEAI